MKLEKIPGGYALYKEKTIIGTCQARPTEQGADITALTIVPEWRRKGYGSYLLKEVLRSLGGYDKEMATVFTAPLPADAGELAFWAKFGFAAVGYLQAMMDNGLNVVPELEAFVQPTIDDSYRDFKDYLVELINGEDEMPDAFAAVNDYIALGAIRAMQELNVNVPITGFDDISFASYSTPSLTTVRVNKRYLGEVAVKRLIEKFSENENTLKIMVSTEIIERDSTK